MVHSAGFEPATHCLEGSCSIQLNYECLWDIYTELKEKVVQKNKFYVCSLPITRGNSLVKALVSWIIKEQIPP